MITIQRQIQVRFCESVPEVTALEEQSVRLQVLGWPRFKPRSLPQCQFCSEIRRDLLRDVALNRKEIRKVSVVRVAPERAAGVDQSGSDTQTFTVEAHRELDHVAGAHLRANASGRG